jgi:cytidine deaminase
MEPSTVPPTLPPAPPTLSPDDLVARALDARTRAYVPYSGYAVGAALLADDGSVTPGCNVENAAYPACLCAERVALSAAVAAGKRRFTALAVATRDGGSPCGLCRQVMAELGPEMAVYIADEQGRYRTTSVAALLPDAFTPDSLK